ncbi:non-ribosomal peptide synthetase [Paenibacillus endoradicis]|uniref:non-ribosomal peptide synthetase n=1 Tax=Paenibacillus endoradicis TaxID=2972487 RepID=UPI002158A732|nr:amino acid adenylation domain-containing protein [Paenibacillus endoradicis]MCR8656493.1 amino acid adenylation domain-containing protein [Paenibacillus endoradicis]
MQSTGLIHQLFEQQADRTPYREAVRFEGVAVTYEELNRRANHLSYRLRSLRVRPDVLVGICMERSIEMVVALYGVLKAGGAYVPLDPDYPKDRQDYMIKDSKVRLVITQHHFAKQFDGFDGDVLILDESESLDRYGEEEGNPNIKLDDNHLAYIFYTSGSTGRPKGAMNTHAAIRNRVLWLQQTFQMQQDDKLLQKSPYSFDVSVWEFFWPHMCGACLVMAKPKGHLDTAYLWEVIKHECITFVQFVPTMLQTFLSEDQTDDLPFLKHVFLCGEPLSSALNERFCRTMSAQLHNLYGPTEAAVFITNWTSDRSLERSVIPIGAAIPENAMYVLNDRYEPVALGEIGELFISGIGLARGYYGRPDLTAERFVPDPYSKQPGARMYHTGDLGRWLHDGNLECLGRNDDQVKVRGFRIELGEISNVLEQHPGVHQVVTVVREDQPGDQRIVTYFLPNHTISPSISELRNHLQQHLPDYMIPSYFVEMEIFPLTASGKTDRKLLPSPTVSRQMIGQEYVPPETYIQKELALIWSGFFSFDQIGLDDDFIDLGGHSLVATQILVRCEHHFGLKVSLKDMLTQGTTIRSLASILEAKLLAETDDAEIEAMLSEMEHLSEAEIEALLK